MNNKYKKPVIGITLDLANDSAKYSYAKFPWYALRQNYADSIIKAGGVPIMIPYQLDSIDNILTIIDGLVIPGGDEDIHPKFYGQEIKSPKVKTNDERANFEFELLKKALAKDIPFLGICNGMQMLNIIFGGDLIQHIPDYIPSHINHEQPPPKNLPSHKITIKPATILAKLVEGKNEIMVNSTHHQAIGKVGNGLLVSAIAPDGIIEAIESTTHKFVVGVEWHPEYLNSDLDLNLFKRLVEAANN